MEEDRRNKDKGVQLLQNLEGQSQMLEPGKYIQLHDKDQKTGSESQIEKSVPSLSVQTADSIRKYAGPPIPQKKKKRKDFAHTCCEPYEDPLLYESAQDQEETSMWAALRPQTEKIGEQADRAGSQAAPDSTLGSISSGPGQIAMFAFSRHPSSCWFIGP